MKRLGKMDFPMLGKMGQIVVMENTKVRLVNKPRIQLLLFQFFNS